MTPYEKAKKAFETYAADAESPLLQARLTRHANKCGASYETLLIGLTAMSGELATAYMLKDDQASLDSLGEMMMQLIILASFHRVDLSTLVFEFAREAGK